MSTETIIIAKRDLHTNGSLSIAQSLVRQYNNEPFRNKASLFDGFKV